jgi:ABC-2 type transport system permease protein
MRNIWTVFKREFGYYFVSPVAYLVMFMFLVTLGLIFSYQLGAAAQYGGAPDVAGWVLGPFVTLALFLTSLLTMRLISEEHRTGTMELIMTAPVREWELVVGKWLAALGYYGVILLVTLIYALIANSVTQPAIDIATLAVSYLGIVLFVGALLAIGLFTSTLFSNQIAAAFAALAVYLGLWLISLPFQDRADTVGDVFNYLNISSHYDNFSTGVIALSDVTYFLTLILFFLFAASQMIESRRWR